MKILVLVLALVLLVVPLASAREPVDRIVATVNDVPVLASDVEDAVRVEALMQGRAVAQVPLADYRAAMARLIDRTLIRQQMTSGYVAPVQQVELRLAQVRAAFPEAKSDAAWRDVLAVYGVGEQQLRKSVEEQVQLMQFVDARLRHMVRVSRDEVESYYKEKLLPELSRKGAAAEPLANVQSGIHELLLQEKIDAQLNAWLASLREQGDVRILRPAVEAATGSGGDSKAMSFSAIVEPR
ncbi:MAG: SurA N-terminal domain-containing protein [Candidatus Korobacteraceae bacterium]